MSGFFIKFIVVVFGVILASTLFVAPYVNQISAVKRKSEIKINDQLIVAEVAKTEGERARGLGGREDIGVNEGMLFLFDNVGVYPFWMKGMKFAIDIVWINGDKIVDITENVAPEPGESDAELAVYYPSVPVNRVLELRAGRVRLLRTVEGDLVKIRPLIPGITK
ncbi:MAG: hypothetical protein UY26_C0003G0279 [Candidatus Jorgensenbacteria bacterium GW2011_GWA1_48_13]|uniref:DUF192 domain-containing protein n=2 Tax=Candidatus Joergenseniibacteriota TaxID=1752739 RepID=A0A0G1W7Z7_9BACT|nr:MAG: hypothetical protein UY26_C0003G0279 [Candidatus Jorgensenbacteria bacterium GW2011_GWA1_48_13]KKU97832.1 MAG: hypothetical protein UY32_C0039G0003 [Candidatus Jorgensenbacteria bacterium GW2011_GWC1_48_8]KKW14833.1 MAG: hypothetical protein UY55_C0003G0049 [Candidatus Jorgensenbacteria bacterium GW2011_GWB1_50_10]